MKRIMIYCVTYKKFRRCFDDTLDTNPILWVKSYINYEECQAFIARCFNTMSNEELDYNRLKCNHIEIAPGQPIYGCIGRASHDLPDNYKDYGTLTKTDYTELEDLASYTKYFKD